MSASKSVPIDDLWLDCEIEERWLDWLVENVDDVMAPYQVVGGEAFTSEFNRRFGALFAAFRSPGDVYQIAAAAGRLLDFIEPHAQAAMEQRIKGRRDECL
jgi:hypothetical protein